MVVPIDPEENINHFKIYSNNNSLVVHMSTYSTYVSYNLHTRDYIVSYDRLRFAHRRGLLDGCEEQLNYCNMWHTI